MIPRKVDRLGDICNILAARDQSRSFVDHAIVDLAYFIVAGIARADQFTLQLSRECVDSLFGKL
jgi:hypothetical protein